MPFDLLIRNGMIVDGSGIPGYRGDVAISGGRIVEVGKVAGEARRVLNADGLTVAPGIVENHTHYDAQVTWDPLCTYSCYHGATTVIMGNCSLALAPAHEGDRETLASVLSHVEAIPLEAIRSGVDWRWETIPQYMDALDQRLGVNVACLIGHSAVRRYVMGEASQERHATDDEVAAMCAIVREGLEAGAVGVSFERNMRHFDWNGRLAPTNLAADEEIFAVAAVPDEVGRGVIQYGGDRELGIALVRRSGRPVFYANVTQQAVAPNRWRDRLAESEALMREGHRAYQFVMPRPGDLRYTLKTAQHFDAMPTWRTVMLLSLEERKRAFRDAATRARLHVEAVETPSDPEKGGDFTRRWDLQFVFRPMLPKNRGLEGKSVAQIAREQGRDVLDVFLDLALEEELDTEFERREVNSDDEAMTVLLTSPYTVIGQSDGGAHVVFRTDYSYATYLLSHWVREKGIMPLEEAIRKLTFIPASLFGLHDRGLVQPGMAADLMVFDPATIGPLEPDEAADLPGGATRRRQLAQGIEWTVVNGQVLIEDGEHTGAYPGRVARRGGRA
ncbi:MAG: N-acyl-D-amino-acid deacylase [Chloroflexota bacterium]|jgi:N-acyl-D-aspartate/D-glutamate deacylase|nr:N-acyl-D-amino-acid deacylase [Chloroflexota bacterium]